MSDDQERCMDLAHPLLVDFHEGWHEAFDKFLCIPAEFTAEYDDTTAANCIRAHMWANVVRRFTGRRGCTLLTPGGLKLLNYQDKLIFRFKLVDGTGRHSNVQTQQQQDFDDEQSLPGIPDAATRLTSGYEPDAARASIDRIIVARPVRRSIEWAAQVNLIDGAVAWTDITPERLPGTERIHVRRRGE